MDDLRTIADVPKDYNSYLELMIQLFKYPSILLRSYCIPFWSSVLNHKDNLKMVPPENIINQLFTTIVEIMDPVKMDSNATDKLHEYLEEDFTEEEFILFETKFRNHLSLLIEYISRLYPSIPFKLLAQGVQHFGGPFTSKFVILIKHSFQRQNTSVFKENLVEEATQHILKTVLEYSSGNNASLWQSQAEVFHACTIYFYHAPQGLMFTVKKLFEGQSILDGTNPDIIPHKRQIHQIIVKFGQEHSKELLVS